MAKTNIQAFSGEVEVASNLQVGTANLFVDITTGKVGIGKTNPTQLLDIVGNVAANVNTLFVDTVNSRVGIGTSNPSTNFDVNGNVNIGSTLTVSGFRITAAAAAEDDLQAITNAGADTDNQIHITNATRAISSSTGALRVGDTGAPGGIGVVGNVYVGDTVTTQDLSVNNVISDFAVNTNDLFVDISESKVGILTTQPHAELHVVGNVYASSNLTVDTDTFHVDAENDRVGVNTKNPEASLHLVGNAFVSSNLEVGTADLFVDTVNSMVGIGTTNPNATLNVNNYLIVRTDGDVRGTNSLRAENTADHTSDRYFPGNGEYPDHTLSLLYQNTRSTGAGPGINFSGSYHATEEYMTTYGTIKCAAGNLSNGVVGYDANFRFYLNTLLNAGVREVFTIMGNTGNVGIGTNDPLDGLHLNTGNFRMGNNMFYQTKLVYANSSAGGTLYFDFGQLWTGDDSHQLLIFTAGGNPAYNLGNFGMIASQHKSYGTGIDQNVLAQFSRSGSWTIGISGSTGTYIYANGMLASRGYQCRAIILNISA